MGSTTWHDVAESETLDEVLANDRVTLEEDLPPLALWQGDEGIVRSTWSYPNCAFEVEFHVGGRRVTVLLLPEQIHARQVSGH
jgi:hypothetical protein